MSSTHGSPPFLPAMVLRRIVPLVVSAVLVLSTVWHLSLPSSSRGRLSYVFDSHNAQHPPPPGEYENGHPDDGWIGRDEGECEPYAMPGHLHINSTSYSSTFFESYTSSCQPAPTPWIQQILESNRTGRPIPELQNKELLTVGDSVDRYLIMDLCTLLGAPLSVHPLNSYTETTENQNGGLSRSCHIPHLNLTMANWFFYGYDEQDIWTDKSNTYTPPGEYEKRWELFLAALKTLPSGGHPDFILTNQGLWELARYDRLLETAGEPDPEPPIISPEFVQEYISKTVSFLSRLRSAVGDNTRIRWRQMHTPTISSGPFFKSPSGEQKKSRARFHPVKIRQMNEVAKEVLWRASEVDLKRRREQRVRSSESGSIKMWPIGDLISCWPTGLWLRDDIHPTTTLGATIWGEGVLEYLARTPAKK